MEHMMPPGPMMNPDQGLNPLLVDKIVRELKINGIFDEMRKECLADIDTKPAFLNVKQRVESHVKGILANQVWSPSLNKNQLRSRIRESVMQSGILNEGVDRILYQVFSAKAYPVFLPKIKDFVKEREDELKKEFLPPITPVEMPPMMMNPPMFEPPPIPEPPEAQLEAFAPPMPSQPPPPESPTAPPDESTRSLSQSPERPSPPAEMSEEILTYEDQEFYVKDVAEDDIIVKPINTPSPQHSSPGLNEDGTPQIPEDVVNPLKSLIQSLLVSKKSLDSLDTVEGELQEEEQTVKSGGHSPTIDASQIEAFTDDEDGDSPQGPKTPVTLGPSTELGVKTPPTPPTGNSPISPSSSPNTPIEPYSPVSPGQAFLYGDSPKSPSAENKSDAEDRTTPAYDPTKFSFQQMSDSTPVNEDFQSPPSPIDVTDTTERSQHTTTDDNTVPDVRRNELKLKNKKRHSPTSSSSGSGSDSSSSGSESSPEDENEKEQTIVMQEEQIIEQVEEMVEEIEVVEEFESAGSPEEGEKIHSDDSEESGEERKIPKAYAEKKKKKKTKKKKVKKPKAKRARSSSISSGEITSSGELSSASSSDSSRPTRPPHPPRHKSPPELNEMEERRRMHREESHHGRPYWPNTGSSSDYISSPRMHRPYSPPRRPYSPEFHRFGSDREREMGYGPPPGPDFRDRPRYPGDYRPRHSRFSPPPYRRSPPRFASGPRMDYPRIPFGSPRSPPRRPYSPPPPRMMGGFPGDRPPYPPRHRWGSPPRRRPSRSPPPPIRRDEGPGPRY